MRKSILLLLGAATLAAPSSATVAWSGPGWYVTIIDPEGEFIWAGPFGVQAACNNFAAALERKTEPKRRAFDDGRYDHGWECVHLDQELPMVDSQVRQSIERDLAAD